MKKSPFAQIGIPKTFTLSQGLTELMEDMLKRPNEFGYFSFSEIVRRGILLAYREQVPPYRVPTVTGRIKQDKLYEVRKIEDMTDEDYNEDVVHGLIYPGTDGNRFVVIHWFGNSIGAVPLLNSKKWFLANQDFVENHLAINATNPIATMVQDKQWHKQLKDDYGIIISDTTITDNEKEITDK